MAPANEGNKRRKLRIATVVDEFTASCLASEATVMPLHGKLWPVQLTAFRPDLVFVESAWRGYRGSWKGKVASYPRRSRNTIARLTSICRRRGIPTAFWNKEDPVLFERFIESAKQFDFIFTTEEKMVEHYHRQAQVPKGHVQLLMFAAQPRLHNPRGARWQNVVCFAGSYGEPEFTDRRADCEMLLDAASGTDLRILDRNSEHASSDKAFPERYRGYLRPAVDYRTLAKLQNQYKVFLNVNTVRDSETMCSRRVFEILASGASLVSGPGRACQALFDDVVSVVDNKEAARGAILRNLSDEHYRVSRAATGMRRVILEHTYRHRLAEICQTVGLPQALAERAEATLFTFVDSTKQADRLLALATQAPREMDIVVSVAVGAETSRVVDRLRSHPGRKITVRIGSEGETGAIRARRLAPLISTSHIACVSLGESLPDTTMANLQTRLSFIADTPAVSLPLSDLALVSGDASLELGAVILDRALFEAAGWSASPEEHERLRSQYKSPTEN